MLSIAYVSRGTDSMSGNKTILLPTFTDRPSHLPPVRPQHRKPPKHVRYAVKAMTVCIAGCCQWGGKQVFALCSDGRLDGGYLGSNDAGHKCIALGYNLLALVCGPWNVARDLCYEISDTIKGGSLPSSKHELLSVIRKGGDVFAAGSIYSDVVSPVD